MIYFDNNATTRMAPEVRDALRPFLDEHYANPSSPYTFARGTSIALADAREHVAALLGVTPNEITFTSGGSESINAVFHAALTSQPERRHLIITAVEHAATMQCAQRAEQAGARVTRLAVDDAGRLDMDAYRAALTDDTALVSVMAANNETGVLFPVDAMAARAAERGVLFHCDATQAVGKMPFRADSPGMTFVSISGHKLHAPKGIGALVVRRGTRLPPFIVGGDQEQGRRAGTENVIGIVGLGAAAQLAQGAPALFEERIRPLREKLEARIRADIKGVQVAGADAPRLPNTSMLLFEGLHAEVMLARLDMEGICCSSGSACASGATEPSHVLSAMGFPPNHAFGAVRISFSRYTSPDEVETFMDRLLSIIHSMRR